MRKNRISVSFVGVYEAPLSMIPNLDEDFCRTIFSSPYDTIYGLSPEGFVIRRNNCPFPAIIVNAQKILFIANNEELLFYYIKMMKEKFRILNFNLKFNSFGLNYEYEWLDLDKDASIWMWDKFISKDITLNNDFHICNNISLKMSVNKSEHINMVVDIRNGVPNGLFASVNHHHGNPLQGLPETDELKVLYEKSVHKLENDYLIKLIG